MNEWQPTCWIRIDLHTRTNTHTYTKWLRLFGQNVCYFHPKYTPPKIHAGVCVRAYACIIIDDRPPHSHANIRPLNTSKNNIDKMLKICPKQTPSRRHRRRVYSCVRSPAKTSIHKTQESTGESAASARKNTYTHFAPNKNNKLGRARAQARMCLCVWVSVCVCVCVLGHKLLCIFPRGVETHQQEKR